MTEEERLEAFPVGFFVPFFGLAVSMLATPRLGELGEDGLS